MHDPITFTLIYCLKHARHFYVFFDLQALTTSNWIFFREKSFVTPSYNQLDWRLLLITADATIGLSNSLSSQQNENRIDIIAKLFLVTVYDNLNL